MKIAAIFLNGKYNKPYEFYKEQCRNASIIIATEKAGLFLNSLGVKPHILVGDFDSCKGVTKVQAHKIVFKETDDLTDGMLALNEALAFNPKQINIYGYLMRADEADHFIGNLELLYKAVSLGISASCIDIRQNTYAVSEKLPVLKIKGARNDIVSLVAFACKRAILEKSSGFRWALPKTIEAGSTLFLRNELSSKNALIKLKKGFLFVFHYKRR
jgi:thiamine pyrophosphokinase